MTRLAPGAPAFALLAAGLAVASCADRAASAVTLSWTLTPAPPVAGPATLTVTLRDGGGSAVTGARVRLEAHMSHPGMAPALADAAERSPGVYVAPFAFSMAGDWVLLVSAALPGGSRVEEQINVANVR